MCFVCFVNILAMLCWQNGSWKFESTWSFHLGQKFHISVVSVWPRWVQKTPKLLSEWSKISLHFKITSAVQIFMVLSNAVLSQVFICVVALIVSSWCRWDYIGAKLKRGVSEPHAKGCLLYLVETQRDMRKQGYNYNIYSSTALEVNDIKLIIILFTPLQVFDNVSGFADLV